MFSRDSTIAVANKVPGSHRELGSDLVHDLCNQAGNLTHESIKNREKRDSRKERLEGRVSHSKLCSASQA